MGTVRAQLWYATPADLDDPARRDACAALLTDEERTRQGAFRFAQHRREFLATRAIVRRVLSSYAAIAPEAWCFVRGPHGKPAVDPSFAHSAGPAADRLRFNLSNTVHLVVCLVSEAREVGVDVEPLARADQVLEVASTVFTPSERTELASLEPPLRDRRAVELWTLKEAYMKARGLGFSLPPDSFAMDGTRLAHHPPAGGSTAWRFDVRVLEEHVVAACIEASADVPAADIEVRRLRL
jgi:4'-phosphopantetheinyl transferase